MQLPLFPLPLVLLPHAPLTLNVFEPRYRAMVAQCLMHQQPFGVVLVQAAAVHSGSGDDQARMQAYLSQFPTAADEYPAYLPHCVATVAIIQDHVVFDDGRFGLQCEGGERVQIVGLTQRLPYLEATVVPLRDAVTPATKAAAMALHEVYARYWRAVQRTSTQQVAVESLPSDEIELSWHLAQRMQVDNDRKQEWLTMVATQRLRSMIVALRAEARTLPLTTPRAPAGEQWSWN
jgi:Lon protease-like protein